MMLKKLEDASSHFPKKIKKKFFSPGKNTADRQRNLETKYREVELRR